MKKKKGLIFMVGGLLILGGLLSASGSEGPGRDSLREGAAIPIEWIDSGTAEAIALYSAARRFERELAVCSSVKMFWPWGEPAVFAVTLFRGEAKPPSDLRLDPGLHYGAALVRESDNLEGYALAAQSQRYVTVFVGASTDMPPFIQAYRGLPEFLIEQAVRTDLPPDPVWFFASPFHILGVARPPVAVEVLSPALLARLEGVEIHTGRSVMLGEIEREKTIFLPEEDRVSEWSPFLASASESLDSPERIPDASIEEKRLPVQEWSNATDWLGCYPASMYNLLIYNSFKHGVRLPPDTPPDFLMLWISVCCRTFKEGFNWMTNPEWLLKGAGLIYSGLDHRAVIKEFSRKKIKREALFNKFVREIKAGYPPEIGCAAEGILKKHSCPGVGYRKINGINSDLIIQDNYASTPNPKYITKYLLEGEYLNIHSIRAKQRKIYADSVPVIKAPKIIELDINKKQWKGKARIKSKNTIKSFVWGIGWEYYNHKGKKLKNLCMDFQRLHPLVLPSGEGYRDNVEFTLPFPKYKRGQLDAMLELIDQNGNPIEDEVKIRLEHVLGKWAFNFKWTGDGSGSVLLYLYKNGVFRTDEGFTGRWSLNKRSFTLDYDGSDTLYVGRATNDYQSKSGTMSCTVKGKRCTGTWNTVRRDSTIYSPPKTPDRGGEERSASGAGSKRPESRILK